MRRTLFPPSRRAAAFSLAELLVAVAVVALLAALFFPAYRYVVASSAASSCAQRVRQTGVGILLYAADHAQTLPGPMPAATFFPYYRATPTPLPTGDGGLYSYLWQYLGLSAPPSSGVALATLGVCPLAERGHDAAWLQKSKFFKTGVHWQKSPYAPYPHWLELQQKLPGNVSYPFGFTESGRLPEPVMPWKINTIPLPAQAALIGEMPGNLDDPTSFHNTRNAPPNLNQHCNILFLDGHVEMRPRHNAP